jgi:hypothetical protein
MVYTNTSLNIINNIHNYWFNFEETGKETAEFVVLGEEIIDLETSRVTAFSEPSDQSISIAIQIENILSALKSMSVIIVNPDDIREYLINFNLELLLIPIFRRVKELFHNNDKFYLKVYHDLEVKDEYLTLYIRQEKYYGNILEIIEELSEEFEERISTTSGWLLITTDFAPPR